MRFFNPLDPFFVLFVRLKQRRCTFQRDVRVSGGIQFPYNYCVVATHSVTHMVNVLFECFLFFLLSRVFINTY